jgi:hypothetical protein
MHTFSVSNQIKAYRIWKNYSKYHFFHVKKRRTCSWILTWNIKGHGSIKAQSLVDKLPKQPASQFMG